MDPQSPRPPPSNMNDITQNAQEANRWFQALLALTTGLFRACEPIPRISNGCCSSICEYGV